MSESVRVTVWTNEERVITEFKNAVGAGLPGMVVEDIEVQTRENSITLQFKATVDTRAEIVSKWLHLASILYIHEGCQFVYEVEAIDE